MNMLELKQLRYRWPASQDNVLDIATFSVAQYERVFIKGPSGCGKTTLLNLIAGVFQPTEGHIKVLDNIVSEYSGARRDKFRVDHIGIIFQQFNLLPYLSILDNVVLPCHFSQLRLRNALSTAGSLSAAAVSLLEQLGLPAADYLQRKVTDLSVGQQQRVAAARALIGAPELVIADEPTSALDEDAQQDFLTLLFKVCADNGSTLLFVSHNRQLQTMFDRVISLAELNQAGKGQVS